MAAIANRDLVMIILLISTVSSASVAAVYSVNYYKFYDAIQQVAMTNPSLSFAPTNSSLNGYAVFNVQNPTSYSGLTLLEFDPSFVIGTSNGTTIPGTNVVTNILTRQSLDPGQSRTFNISFTGSGMGPYEVNQFVHHGLTLSQINFNFTIGVLISTFLDNYTTFRAFYFCNSQLGGGTCLQVGVLLSNANPRGPSGGGGGV